MADTIYPKMVIDVLSKVRYPGNGNDIVTLGMVEDDIKIEGNKISFSLIFEKANDPFRKSLVKACETAILTYISKDIAITGNINIKLAPAPPKHESAILPGVKNIIAVASGKGGVGKSTVAANLAVALALQGYKTGLMDADIFGPSVPTMFGLVGEKPLLEEKNGIQGVVPLEKYGTKLLSLGFFVNPDDALVWRGAMATNAIKQMLNESHWGELDYFILDMPPGTSDVHLTIVQTLPITGAVIVSTPQEVALADARKGISMFTNSKINVPVLGLVENMAWFTPAELPENKYYIFGKDGCKSLAKKMNVPLLGQIPIVQSIREGGDEGIPVAYNTNSISGMAFAELANNVVKAVNHRNEILPPSEKVKMQ